ncbi:acyl-CoA dehydrogenase family protein, partial [Kibdelosporangium lantanae]
LARMLDLAVERLSGRTFAGVPLIDQQLVAGAVADVVTDLELLRAAHYEKSAADLHERVTEAGWTVTRMFGAEGYVADHPVRALYVSALVADIWIPRWWE